MIDREAIQEIVSEVLNRLLGSYVGSEAGNKPNLLVMNAKEGFPDDEWEKEWNVVKISASSEDVLPHVHAVLFFDVSQDLLVKGALGIADSPDSKRLAHFLMRGVRIGLIPSAELAWIISPDVNRLLNQAYANHLLQYKANLEAFGVSFHSFANLSATMFKPERDEPSRSHAGEQVTFHGKLLTQSEVENSKEQRFVIRKSTIVTPLARDAARELGKSIDVID